MTIERQRRVVSVPALIALLGRGGRRILRARLVGLLDVPGRVVPAVTDLRALRILGRGLAVDGVRGVGQVDVGRRTSEGLRHRDRIVVVKVALLHGPVALGSQRRGRVGPRGAARRGHGRDDYRAWPTWQYLSGKRGPGAIGL